jgi:type IV secretory pathway VirB4 component
VRRTTKLRLALERQQDRQALRRRRCQPATWRWYSMPAFGFVRPGARHGHVATTAHAQAIYPFVNEENFGSQGVIVGPNVYGGRFAFDQWRGYAQGFLHDPDILVLGLKGEGKSALVKTLAYRLNAVGRRIEVIDPKGEYQPIVEAMGGVTLTMRPGVSLNPLERIDTAGIDEQERKAVQGSRLSLLRSSARTLLDRDLTPIEKIGLAAALQAVDDQGNDHVVIPDIVEELRNPSPAVAAELNMSAERVAEGMSECMLVLRDISIGPLRGMFDAPTTGRGVWDQDALSIDVSKIAEHTQGGDESTALALTLICCTALLDARRRARNDAKKTMRINDEAWRALAVPGAADYYTSALKLSRKTGVSNVLVLHKLSDLSAAGDTGTRTQKLAEGLAAETAIRVIYCQADSQADLTARTLQLNSTERQLITTLAHGEALWLAGQRRFRVRHQIAELEWDLVQTDEAMAERPRETVGVPAA